MVDLRKVFNVEIVNYNGMLYISRRLGLTENTANSLLGIVVSSVLVGCVIGGLLSGLVSLKLGRKNGLILAALLFLLSALGSAMPEKSGALNTSSWNMEGEWNVLEIAINIFIKSCKIYSLWVTTGEILSKTPPLLQREFLCCPALCTRIPKTMGTI